MASLTKKRPRVIERILAKGHKNVKATHRTTLEVTKDKYLTPRGDCIIAISANKAASDLSESFKYYLKKPGSILVVVLRSGTLQDTVVARGSPNLLLSSPRSIVIRKSRYIDERTIAIEANKAAIDINRELIRKLKSREATLEILLMVFTI